MNFGHLIEIEQADKITIPDQVDHLPPDMTAHLMKIKRFSKDSSGVSKIKKTDVNVKFLQAAASADTFALGVILLQIATGCPS